VCLRRLHHRRSDPRPGATLRRVAPPEELAELLRIKGELILREGAPQAAMVAEKHFLDSLDWARRQGALSWELRTSTSLSCLQHDQGWIAEARSLLQSVYGRFSEGFETADLKAAKGLLESWQ
jgi:predicted ATPase